jgi:hypothetical protein
MKKGALIFALFVFYLRFEPPYFISVRRVKSAIEPAYFKLIGQYLGRELSGEEKQRFEGAVGELSEALEFKNAPGYLTFILHRAGEISKGDPDIFLDNVRLFSELVRQFPKEAMKRSFKAALRKAVEASRADPEALESNVEALCEMCLFLEIAGSDPNQIRELSWLAKLYSKSPQDYALNLMCYLNIYEGLLGEKEIYSKDVFLYIPIERRPEPLDFLKGYSQIAWNIFEEPKFYRQMLLYFTRVLGIFLTKTGLNYKEAGKQIRQFYLRVSFKVIQSLNDLVGEGIAPVQVGKVLEVVTHLSSALYNASREIGFDELGLIVEELIDVGKEMAKRADLGKKVSAFKSILGKHGMQLIIPLLAELNVDVGKELIYISKILKEVSIKRPQLEKGKDEVQEFKDCMKALRDFLQAIKEAGYKDNQVENILGELNGFKDIALHARYPARKFQGLVHRKKEKIRNFLGIDRRG